MVTTSIFRKTRNLFEMSGLSYKNRLINLMFRVLDFTGKMVKYAENPAGFKSSRNQLQNVDSEIIVFRF